jgi:hypothetical protein
MDKRSSNNSNGHPLRMPLDVSPAKIKLAYQALDRAIATQSDWATNYWRVVIKQLQRSVLN